jgi:hypothetical protein
VITRWGKDKEVNLLENQERIRNLYQLGCDEAALLNLSRIKRLIEELGLDVDPATVEVQTEQPKGNTKLFNVSALVIDGVSHPVRQKVVYHVPHVSGKARANDAGRYLCRFVPWPTKYELRHLLQRIIPNRPGRHH